MTHLFFMDDLKVYADSTRALERMMKTVEDLSEAIGMRMGLNKCATLWVRQGEVVRRGPMRLGPRTCICEIKEGETYKYLGVSQLLTHDLLQDEGSCQEGL